MKLETFKGRRPGLSRYIGRLPQSTREAWEMLGERDSRTILTNTTLVRGEFMGRDIVDVNYHGLRIARFTMPTATLPGLVEVRDAGYATTSTTARLAAIIHGQGLVTRVIDGARRIGSVKYGEVTLPAYPWVLVWSEGGDGRCTVHTAPETHHGERAILIPA